MNIQGCVPRFCKTHGSLVLTILSGIGLVATVIATAKAAPEAEYAICDMAEAKLQDVTARKMEETGRTYAACYEEAVHSDETAMTTVEKLQVALPHYTPVILLGLGTMACMAGAHILDMRKQAAMMASYALLHQSFGSYRAEIRDKYGEEADKEAYISSQEKIKALKDEIRRLEEEKGVYTFAVATAPGLIFRAKMAQVEQAFAHFNRNLCLRGYGTLQELHGFLGLPVNCPLVTSPTAPDEEYGWNEYINEVNYGIGWVDFRMKQVVSKDGEIVYVIWTDIPPYRLDAEEDTDVPELYDTYDPERAIEAAKDGYSDAAMRVDVDPDHVVYAQTCL